jgi:riboflavin biosynthesis pyrimidine reductase
MSLPVISDLETLRRGLTERFGAMPGSEEGVLHVAAVWRPPGEDRNVVLRIGDDTPKSAVDFLLLNVARARADAIVTTGRILREEPELVHDLQGTPSVRRALNGWRRETLGIRQPPWLLVLTSGHDLDPAHPAFRATVRPVVFCPDSNAASVARRVGYSAIEVVGHPGPDLSTAIEFLRARRDARRISIEAGPSTALEAYRDPALVEELLLSVFQGPSIPPEVEGGELPTSFEIERILGPVRAAFSAAEPSGPWRFERYGCAIVAGEASSR